MYSRDHPFSKAHKDSLKRILVFGGVDIAQKPRGSWVFTPYDNSWFRLCLDRQPPERSLHSLTSICDNFVVLFGGALNDENTSIFNVLNMRAPTGDVWIFNGVEETWEDITPASDERRPNPRYSYSAATLSNSVSSCHCRQSVMIYGGAGGLGVSVIYDDLWELRCVSQRVLSLSFEWFRHRKQPGGNWPPPSAFHSAMHVDEKKTAMLVWGSGALPTGEKRSYSLQFCWLYNISSQRWSLFHTQRQTHDQTTSNIDALIGFGSSAVFHTALNLIIEISPTKIYFLNLKDRRWTYMLWPRTSSAREYTTQFIAAVYFDSSIFLFTPTHRYFSVITKSLGVWVLLNQGRTWNLELLSNPTLEESPLRYPNAVWNRIGDDLILVTTLSSDNRHFLDICNGNTNKQNITQCIWNESSIQLLFTKELKYRLNREGYSKDTSNANANTLQGIRMDNCILALWPYSLMDDKVQVLVGVNDGNTASSNNLYLSWHIDLITKTWHRYLTNMSFAAIQKTAASANWNDKSLVVYGGMSAANQRVDDQGNLMNFYTSDVSVYYSKSRQWFTVKTTGERPPGRVHSTFVYVPPNSFLLYGGASMWLQKSDFMGPVSNLNFHFNLSNIADVKELLNTLEVRNDLWLLTLSDCREDCLLTGVTGNWTKIESKDSPYKPVTGRMGHSAVYIDNEMFVIGGFKFTTFKRLFCYDNIWSYDTWRKTWKTFDASTGRVKLSLSHLGLCRTPATILQSRIVISVSPRNDLGNSRLLSYLKDHSRSHWVDHNISFSFFVDRLFTWHDRVIGVTHMEYKAFYLDRVCMAPGSLANISIWRLECKPGQFSSNWSTEVCSSCQIGHFAPKANTTSCTKCPIGLTTTEIGAISIANCSCNPKYCKHGDCLVISTQESKEAVCKCDFGYTGERCEFPTFLIIIFTSTAALIIITIMVRFVQKMKKYKEQKRADSLQLEDMNRAWTIDCSEIHLMHRLDLQSPGSYGDVYRATYRDFTVAVKKLKVEMRNDVRVEREFEREIQVMKSIRHQNIVLFIGAGKFRGENDCPFLVLEFMPGGSLCSLLRNQDVEYDLRQQISFCLDTARGMEFLHDLSPPRIHRDIKSSNLLLSEQLVVKVSDFGSARLVKRRESIQRVQRSRGTPFRSAEDVTTPLLNPNSDLSRNVGAVLWRAPEVFLRQSYGTAIDVYRLIASSKEVNKKRKTINLVGKQ